MHILSSLMFAPIACGGLMAMGAMWMGASMDAWKMGVTAVCILAVAVMAQVVAQWILKRRLRMAGDDGYGR